MKRRRFLQQAIKGVVLPSFVNGISLRALADVHGIHQPGRQTDDGRVLVLIQLAGGNDGLNTVIPLDQYSNYVAARPNIALPEDRILRLSGTDSIGFHPSMSGMQGLFNNGQLGIVQSVSYPKPNFSHFRATDIWMTASDSDKMMNTGWLGRYLDDRFAGFPQNYPSAAMPDPLAIQVGSVLPTAFQGPLTTMGMAISNPSGFYRLIEGKANVSSQARWGEQLDFIKMMSEKTDQYAGVVKAAALRVTSQSSKYPDAGKNPLADQLKIVARLVAGGLKTKVYMTTMGGFDTHARQTETDTTTGAHAKLWQKVSEAIDAFMDDLQQQQVDQRVMGITFSEFGRRIKSNASGGTDHGAAAPVFYFGHALKAGINGRNPLLPANATVNDNIPMQTDFRSLYASLLGGWLGMDQATVENVLGGSFETLPIV